MNVFRKPRWAILLSLLAVTTLSAANPYRILVVGDSISVGYTDNPNWTVPFEFGYRSGLYTRLTNSGMAVQFVGNSPEPWDGRYNLPTNTLAFDLRLIGQDHCEGYGGKRTDYVLANLPDWLAVHSPDIILLMVGSRGAGESAKNAMNVHWTWVGGCSKTFRPGCPSRTGLSR